MQAHVLLSCARLPLSGGEAGLRALADGLSRSLCGSEAARVARKARAQDAAASAVGALLLLRAAGAPPGAQVHRPAAAQGRPAVAQGSGADANAAHDGRWAVAAAAVPPAARVGVDVVELARLPAAASTGAAALARYLSPGERALLARAAAAGGGSAAAAATATLWSLKEAMAKALGCGLTLRLAGMDFSADAEACQPPLDVAAAALAAQPLALPPPGEPRHADTSAAAAAATPFWAPLVRCVAMDGSAAPTQIAPPPLEGW